MLMVSLTFLSGLKGVWGGFGPAAAICALLLGAAGCQPLTSSSTNCSTLSYGGIAADASDTIYVAVTSTVYPEPPYAGGSYLVERATDGKVFWNGDSDGTAIGLVAPQTDGVVVVGGGAAARRIDASGVVDCTIGYGAMAGSSAAVTDTGDFATADTEAVRLFQADGTPIWERSLPPTLGGIPQVLGDRAGGVWVLGVLQQSGPLIVHIDGSGTTVGANDSWAPGGNGGLTLGRAAVAVDAAGAPILVIVQGGGSSGVRATAFDRAAQFLWSRALSPTTLAGVYGPLVGLQVDRAGDLFEIEALNDSLTISRWDAQGNLLGSAPFSPSNAGTGGLDWVSAPDAGGILIAGVRTMFAEDFRCGHERFIVRVDTNTMQVTPVANAVH
jgi:hypothetical protein